MTTPAPADAAALRDALARARVLDPDPLADLTADFRGASAADLAAHLVGRGALTRFQADRALAGFARSLVLGPYRVTGPARPTALGPAVAAVKAGRGGPTPAVLVAVPLRSLWRAKQARELARRVAAVRPHPAVVPLLDADSANGFHFLAWPVAHGDRLADRVAAAGPLRPEKAAAVLAQLAAGLAACHAAGLPHGLLTPASVVLPAGAAPARLLDLGAGLVLADDLANRERLLDTLTAGGALARFLPYAAPEWLATPTSTPAADQFSLGAVGFFAVAGRPPRPGDRAADVPGVPAGLAAVLDRLLAADPAARFGGADEAHAALVAAADDTDPGELLDPPSELVGAAPPQPTGGTSQGGSVSMGGTAFRPPDRDDTADSVRFDLPDPVDDAPVLNGPPAATPPPAQAPRPPAPTPPPPKPPPSDERPSPLALPRLPAAPLVSAAPASRSGRAAPAPSLPPIPAPTGSDVWKRVRRSVLFWKAPTDTVRVHVYGPPTAARSEAPRVTVFLFPPAAADSVATLARAFDHDAALLGAGTLAVDVARGEELAVHLSVAGVSVTTPLRTVAWQGSPCRAEFDLVVPWEAPTGPAAGVVSVGRDAVRVGKAEFPLVVTADRG